METTLTAALDAQTPLKPSVLSDDAVLLELRDVADFLEEAPIPLGVNVFPEYVCAKRTEMLQPLGDWAHSEKQNALALLKAIRKALDEAKTEAQWDSGVSWRHQTLLAALKMWRAYRGLYELHRQGYCPGVIWNLKNRTQIRLLVEEASYNHYDTWRGRSSREPSSMNRSMKSAQLNNAYAYRQAREAFERLGFTSDLFVDVGAVPARSKQQTQTYRYVETYNKQRKEARRRMEELGLVERQYEGPLVISQLLTPESIEAVYQWAQAGAHEQNMSEAAARAHGAMNAQANEVDQYLQSRGRSMSEESIARYVEEQRQRFAYRWQKVYERDTGEKTVFVVETEAWLEARRKERATIIERHKLTTNQQNMLEEIKEAPYYEKKDLGRGWMSRAYGDLQRKGLAREEGKYLRLTQEGEDLYRALRDAGLTLMTGSLEAAGDGQQGEAPTAEPEAVVTSDGYLFERLEDGSYCDGDMSYGSFEELHEALEGDYRVASSPRFQAPEAVLWNDPDGEAERWNILEVLHHDGDTWLYRIARGESRAEVPENELEACEEPDEEDIEIEKDLEYEADREAEERFECQNCAMRWREDELVEAKHLTQRVDPGEPMPAGECPECGALCHELDEEDDPTTPGEEADQREADDPPTPNDGSALRLPTAQQLEEGQEEYVARLQKKYTKPQLQELIGRHDPRLLPPQRANKWDHTFQYFSILHAWLLRREKTA